MQEGMGGKEEVERTEAELLTRFNLRPRMARTPPGGEPLSAPPAVSESAFQYTTVDCADTPKRSRDDCSPEISPGAAPKKSKSQKSLLKLSEELGVLIESLIHVFRPKAVRHITKANRDSFLRMKQLQGEISSRLADNSPKRYLVQPCSMR